MYCTHALYSTAAAIHYANYAYSVFLFCPSLPAADDLCSPLDYLIATTLALPSPTTVASTLAPSPPHPISINFPPLLLSPPLSPLPSPHPSLSAFIFHSLALSVRPPCTSQFTLHPLPPPSPPLFFTPCPLPFHPVFFRLLFPSVIPFTLPSLLPSLFSSSSISTSPFKPNPFFLPQIFFPSIQNGYSKAQQTSRPPTFPSSTPLPRSACSCSEARHPAQFHRRL